MLTGDSVLSGIEYVRSEDCNNYEIAVIQPQINGFSIVSSITATVSSNNQTSIFRVTVTSSPSNVAAPQQWLAAVGSTVQLRAVTNTCWTFNEWTGNVAVNDHTSANTSFVMPAHDVSVVAHYTASTTLINVTVTASPSNGGSVTITPTGTLKCGDRITLTAVPVSGYQFDAWWHNGAVVSRSPMYVNPNPGEYTAVFVQKTNNETTTPTSTASSGTCNITFDIIYGADAFVQLSDGTTLTLTPSGFNGVQTIEKACGTYGYTVSKNGYTPLPGTIDAHRNITISGVLSVIPNNIPASWSLLFSNNPVKSLVIKPQLIYAGTTANTIYSSIDGGIQWIDLKSVGVLPNDSIIALAIDPTNPQIVYVGTNNGIHKSTDGGLTWTFANLGGVNINVLIISPINSKILYASSSEGLYQSTDGGAHWYFKGSPGYVIYSLAADLVNPQIVYVGTSRGVYKCYNQ